MYTRSKAGEARRLEGIRKYYQDYKMPSEMKAHLSQKTKEWFQKNGRDPKERFWEKVKVGSPNECWEWTRPIYAFYPYFSIKRQLMPAHRVSYLFAHGSIPEGVCICHTCDNPKCVNPNHLYAGNHKSNMADCIKRKRFKFLGPRSGIENHNSKLTPEIVREIRAIYPTLKRPAKGQFANKIGISQVHCRRIVDRVMWSHVD